MTGAVRTVQNDIVVSVNPFLMFIMIFLVPYLLFFLLIMSVTGLVEPLLILETIIQKSSLDFVKIWVIGSFILSLLATLYLSGNSATHYLLSALHQRKHSDKERLINEENARIDALQETVTEQTKALPLEHAAAKLPENTSSDSIHQDNTVVQMAKRYQMLDQYLS